MTTYPYPVPAPDPGWDAFAAAQVAAENEYKTATDQASAEFALDLAAILDTYHRVERIAWSVYMRKHRSAVSAYHQSMTTQPHYNPPQVPQAMPERQQQYPGTGWPMTKRDARTGLPPEGNL